MISKRRFLASAPAVLLFSALAAQRAAGRKRMVRCTYPNTSPEAMARMKANWATSLAKHGFTDGQNLEIEVVAAQSLDWVNDPEWKAIARRVIDSRPDVIVVEGFWLEIFEPITREIPIVFTWMIDPEYFGTIHSPRRPGGNITGQLIPFFECQGKRLEMLKELRPDARRAALVLHPGGRAPRMEEKFRDAARRLGMEGVAAYVPDSRTPGAVTEAVRSARVQLADFLFGVDIMPTQELEQLIKLGIAASCVGSDTVEAGALLCYNVDSDHSITENMVAGILRGEAVAKMPAQQSGRFWLGVNLRTARALGLRVPASILVRADRIIE